jgi:hypothetical protein
MKRFHAMRIVVLIAILLSSVFCLNGWAADMSPRNWDKRFTLYGGGILYNMDGTFSSAKDGRPDIDVDMEDLGLDEHELAYFLGATLRAGDRFRIRFDYFRYHDNSTTMVDEEFEFDGEIYPVGALIDSKLNIDLYVVNLSYDLYLSKKASFGIGVGVHVADLDLNIHAEGQVGGIGDTDGDGEEDILAPLPNLYAAGNYAFRDDLILRYAGGWMSMSYDEYDGDLLFARASLEYWPFKNMGIGAGYSYFSIDIDYDKKNSSKKEKYDIDMPGPVAYLTVGF